MRETWSTLFRFVLLAIGIAGVVALSDSAGLTVALVACALVALAFGVLGSRRTAGTARACPQRAIDESILLAQSHPDAPGRRRPRAPGAR